MAEQFFAVARNAYRGLVITSARRTASEQLRLWQAAQRGENNGLPAMRPGTSDHEVGLAFDMANPGVDPLHDDALFVLGDAWKRWGGRWGPKDPVHFAAPVGRARAPTWRSSRPRRWGSRVASRRSSRRRRRLA